MQLTEKDTQRERDGKRENGKEKASAWINSARRPQDCNQHAIKKSLRDVEVVDDNDEVLGM